MVTVNGLDVPRAGQAATIGYFDTSTAIADRLGMPYGYVDDYSPDPTLYPDFGWDVGDTRAESATSPSTVTATKDTPTLRVFRAPQDMVVTGLRMASGTTVSAGLTLARYCLYHVGTRYNQTDFNEMSFTPIARSASDTTLFNVTVTEYARNWSATGGWPTSVRLIKGERYAVGHMLSGTTAPNLVSGTFMRTQANGSTVQPMLGLHPGGLEANTDLNDYWNGGSNVFDGSPAVTWHHLICDPLSIKARPFRMAMLGDSYFSTAGGWVGLANAQSGSLYVPTWNAGVGGETTTSVLARIAWVTARRPQVTIVSCGINDVAASASFNTVTNNLMAIILGLRAAGSKVIICTLPPTSSMSAANLAVLSAVNLWMRNLVISNVYVAETGVTLSTGNGVTQNAGLFIDGVHPNNAGKQAMADALDDVLAAVALTTF